MLLTAVILGLAVCDLAISVHRLLAAGGRVRWDWLAPLAALVAFLKIVSQWWTFFNAGPLAKGLTFEMFLGVLVASVLLFLLAADALPDETGDGWIDLRAHWASVSRRFWLLFVSQFVLLTAVSTWAQVVIEKAHLNSAIARLAGAARRAPARPLEEPLVADARLARLCRGLHRAVFRPASGPGSDALEANRETRHHEFDARSPDR